MRKYMICSFLSLLTIVSLGQSKKVNELQLTPSEDIIQRQLIAYNSRNLDHFLSFFTDDVNLYNFPDELILEGKESMRERYKTRFESPNLHAEIISRTHMGDYFIEHESVAGIREEKVEAIVIYHLSDNLIDKMWFIIK